MRKHLSRPIVWRTVGRLLADVVRFASIGFKSHSKLAAENLFLRKQLVLYRERQVKPRRADDATRIALVMLSNLFDWRAVLTIVKPDTLIRWHRKGFRFLWRWKARAPGRPPLPPDVQELCSAENHAGHLSHSCGR
jgi:putative transposase